MCLNFHPLRTDLFTLKTMPKRSRVLSYERITSRTFTARRFLEPKPLTREQCETELLIAAATGTHFDRLSCDFHIDTDTPPPQPYHPATNTGGRKGIEWTISDVDWWCTSKAKQFRQWQLGEVRRSEQGLVTV